MQKMIKLFLFFYCGLNSFLFYAGSMSDVIIKNVTIHADTVEGFVVEESRYENGAWTEWKAKADILGNDANMPPGTGSVFAIEVSPNVKYRCYHGELLNNYAERLGTDIGRYAYWQVETANEIFLPWVPTSNTYTS